MIERRAVLGSIAIGLLGGGRRASAQPSPTVPVVATFGGARAHYNAFVEGMREAGHVLVNLTTARTLKIAVPQQLLGRADRVIGS